MSTTTAQSTPEQMAERLPLVTARLDARINSLREQIVGYAESVVRDAARIAEAAASGGTPRLLGRSSAGSQLDEAVTELNALVEERKMITYVIDGPADES